MEVQRCTRNEIYFDRNWIEQIILHLGDTFDIRIAWNRETALVTGACAVVGGLVGSYAGGRLGATLGAGLAGVAGYGVSSMVSLRELWITVKDQLEELFYIVLNFLRRLDPVDYYNAFELLLASQTGRTELTIVILSFIASKLNREVVSRIAAA